MDEQYRLLLQIRATAQGVHGAFGDVRRSIQSLRRELAAFNRDSGAGAGLRSLLDIGRSVFGGLLGLIRGAVSAVLGLAAAIGRTLVGVLTAVGRAATIAFGVGFAGLTAAAVAFARRGVSVGNTLEGIERGFTRMLGSGAAAKEMMAEITKEAETSSNSMKDIAGWAQRLMAVGFSSKEVLPAIRALGDALAGMGAAGDPEKMQRIMKAFSDWRNKGRLLAEEAMQFQEAGVNPYRVLGIEEGTDVEKLVKAKDPRVMAKTGIPLFIKGLQQQFGGTQEAAAGSLPVVLNNIGDALDIISSKMMGFGRADGFRQSLTRAATGVLDFLSKLHKTKEGERILGPLTRAFDAVGRAVERAAAYLPGIAEGLAKWLESGKLEEWGGKAYRVFLLIKSWALDAAEWVQQHWGGMLEWLGKGTFNVFRMVGAATEFLRGVLETFFQSQDQNGKSFTDTLKQIGNGFKQWAADTVRMVTLLTERFAAYGAAITWVAAGLAALSGNLSGAALLAAASLTLHKATARDEGGMTPIKRAGFSVASEIESLGKGSRDWAGAQLGGWEPGRVGMERAKKFWGDTAGMGWGGYTEGQTAGMQPRRTFRQQATDVAWEQHWAGLSEQEQWKEMDAGIFPGEGIAPKTRLPSPEGTKPEDDVKQFVFNISGDAGSIQRQVTEVLAQLLMKQNPIPVGLH